MYSFNIIPSSFDNDCLDLFVRALILRVGDTDCPRDFIGCNRLVCAGDNDSPRVFIGCKVLTGVCRLIRRRRPLFFFGGFGPPVGTANGSRRGNRS